MGSTVILLVFVAIILSVVATIGIVRRNRRSGADSAWQSDEALSARDQRLDVQSKYGRGDMS